MFRLGRVIAAALSLSALLALPTLTTAVAQTATPSLATWNLITGRSGFTDVHLDHFSPISVDFNLRTRPSYMQINGDPSAAVVLMSQAAVNGDSSASWIPILKLPATGDHQVIYWHDNVRGLKAGNYRVFLVADRATTVRFYLPGQVRGSARLPILTRTRSAESEAATEGTSATDDAVKSHTNSLFFTVHRRALSFGVEWRRASQAPLAEFDTICTYVDDPIGGQPLPGCPGAFLVFNYGSAPFTTPEATVGYAVTEPPGRIGVAVQDTVVGPTRALGSALYFVEY